MSDDKEPRYTHYIRVPFAGTFLAIVDSDDEEPSPEDLYALFESKYGTDLAKEQMTGPLDVDEWGTYAYLQRGNTSYVPCCEVEIDSTEDSHE